MSAASLVASSVTSQNGACSIDDLEFTISNHAVQASYPGTAASGKGSCPVDTFANPLFPDRSWQVEQFHVHPSEHTVDEVGFGGELHMLHKPVTGGDSLAVVALFLLPTAKDDNPAFSLILDRFEESAREMLDKCGLKMADISGDGTVAARSEPLDSPSSDESTWSIYDLIPNGTGFYFYHGGLTTPPCTEIVQWNVANLPVAISVRQYTKLVDTLLSHIDPKTCQGDTVATPSGSTSRPTQPSNGRDVELVCPVDSYKRFSGYRNESREKWKESLGFTFLGAVSMCCLMGLWWRVCYSRRRDYKVV